MNATINVNLRDRDEHGLECAALPVLIPCPIPHSVTFTVTLGACDCNPGLRGHRGRLAPHLQTCPARPIRVSCDIGGDGTWTGSDVVGTETRDGALPSLASCRDRWALIKALVTGKNPRHDVDTQALHTIYRDARLFEQRDAVFEALAKLERADSAAREAHQEAFKALDAADVAYSTTSPVGSRAAAMLAAYVERLIEQVGNLEGGE